MRHVRQRRTGDRTAAPPSRQDSSGPQRQRADGVSRRRRGRVAREPRLEGHRFPAAHDAPRSPARAGLVAGARGSAGARDGFGDRRHRRRARLHHARQPEGGARVQDRARARQGDAVGRSFATSQKIPQEVFATGRERIVADLRDERFRRPASRHGGARDPPRAVHAAAGRAVSRAIVQRPRAAADRRAVSRQPREGAVDVGRGAQRARSGRGRSRVGDRKRAPLSRGDRKSADGARDAARRGNSARAAARGDAVRPALRRRCGVDSVPQPSAEIFSTTSTSPKAASASRSATSPARGRRRRC